MISKISIPLCYNTCMPLLLRSFWDKQTHIGLVDQVNYVMS